MTENDASVIEDDAGIIEDIDASIAEDDAGDIEDNDASIIEIEDDAGTGEEDIEFVSIPSGAFTLSHYAGSYSTGDTVTFENAFALKKTPVTVAEFERCVAANACTSEHYYTVSDGSYCNYNRGENWKNHPMNCVDWDGAKEYCAWIGGRLPTQEEWEYASTHNGTQHLDTTYPWGNDAPRHCVTAQYKRVLGEESLYCQGDTTAPVYNREGTGDVSLHSTAGDSPLGLVDMSGNVWEWTGSFFIRDDSSCLSQIKGGSWLSEDLFVTMSVNFKTTNWDHDVGFRCAKQE